NLACQWLDLLGEHSCNPSCRSRRTLPKGGKSGAGEVESMGVAAEAAPYERKSSGWWILWTNTQSQCTTWKMNQPNTEMRPIRDKQWIAMAAQTIMDHLIQSRLPLPLERKSFDQGPTLKLFQAMAAESLKRTITLMKDLRYPHADQISRTALQEAGSGHAWPATLAMLYWMVELSQAKLQWWNPELCDDPNLTPIKSLRRSTSLPTGSWQATCTSILPASRTSDGEVGWISSGYPMNIHLCEWISNGSPMDIQPTSPSEVLDAGKILCQQQSNGGVMQETEQKGATLKKALAEIEQLLAHNEVEQLEKEPEPQLADSENFQKMIEHKNSKKAKLEEALQVPNQAISESEERLVKLRSEHGGLLKAVEQQNLSPEEATRMTTERDTLARTLEDLRQRIADTSKTGLGTRNRRGQPADWVHSMRQEKCEVANIHTAAQQSAVALDSRLQALEFDHAPLRKYARYSDIHHKTTRLRDEVLKEIVNHTEAIVTFRTQHFPGFSKPAHYSPSVHYSIVISAAASSYQQQHRSHHLRLLVPRLRPRPPRYAPRFLKSAMAREITGLSSSSSPD
ncbi:hypothetical protein CALVIDRAFT_574860, partial [Calocera viscosa TUFC12733]